MSAGREPQQETGNRNLGFSLHVCLLSSFYFWWGGEGRGIRAIEKKEVLFELRFEHGENVLGKSGRDGFQVMGLVKRQK